MSIYGKEAIEQDLKPIQQTVATAFTSQINRLKAETSSVYRAQSPGRQLLTDINNYWINAQEGFVLNQTIRDIKSNGIDPALMIKATQGLKFEDLDDVLIEMKLLRLKENIHSNPRMTTYGVTLVTMAELSRNGLTTLAGLDLPYEQTQEIPDARNHPVNWSRNLSPENIWQTLYDLRKWSRLGLVNPDKLSRTDAEKVVAASQFFGWANYRLQQTLPSAA